MPALEDEENLVREYYYWVPPVNHIPPGAEISPEEQRIEDEIARKHPNRGSPKWTSGGWLKLKGEKSAKRANTFFDWLSNTGTAKSEGLLGGFIP